MTQIDHEPVRLHGGRVPVSTTTSPEFFARERDLFGTLWLRLAFTSEIPDAGDYVVKPIDVLGVRILIVRGRDGAVRAFHNVCRHRGNQLAEGCAGKTRSFVCGFHGWVYDLEGSLRHVMEENDFDPLDKSALGLKSVHVGEWNGMVFVNLAQQPAETLKDFLAPLAENLGTVDLAGMRLQGTYTADVDANWKTAQDAFIEAYHVRTVHARSLPNLRQNWIPRKVGALGQHTTMTAYQEVVGEPAPTERVIWGMARGFMTASPDSRLPVGVNRDRNPHWVFEQFSVFPNQLLMIGDGWFTHHEFWPVTVNTCRWSASYYVPPTNSPAQDIANEFFKVRVRDTVLEDLAQIEAVQYSYDSGAIEEMTVCGQEAQIARHRQVLQGYLADMEAGTR